MGCKADFKNINIIGRRDRSDIITSRSSNIISGSLSGRESRRGEVHLVRDLVGTLIPTNGNQELQTTDVTGVSADTTEALRVSGTQNVNINNGSSSDIATDNDSNMRTTEQAVPTEGQDLLTTMKPVESKPTS